MGDTVALLFDMKFDADRRRQPLNKFATEGPREATDSQMDETEDLLAAARSALDLAVEALELFEERIPEIVSLPDPPMIGGRRVEISLDGRLSRRGLIGAQAFLANLVIVENCVRRMASLENAAPVIKRRATIALSAIQAIVDREVRNTAEHIDDRIVKRADRNLISNSIFDDDLLCSTKGDGSIGAVAVNRVTLAVVHDALYSIFYTSSQMETARLPAKK
jgi:hypothetical protein